MTSRRRFLAALGAGIGGLGLPGVAHAWGRRGRRGSCQVPQGTCVGEAAPNLMTTRLQCACLCPQSRALMNGIYYYGALDCSTDPPTNTGFSSATYYAVPAPCPAANCNCTTAGCIAKGLGGERHPRALKCVNIHGHYLDPSKPLQLAQVFDPTVPANAAFDTGSDGGQVLVYEPYDTNINVGPSDTRPVRLWLLALFADPLKSGTQPTILAVGQESVKNTSTETLSTEPGSSHYVRVAHRGVCFHVLLANAVGG